MQPYWISLLGLLLLCLLPVLLAVYAGASKGRGGLLSGPVLPPDQSNRLYRIDRTHMNAVEALGFFIMPAILAMLAGVAPGTLAVLVWLYAAIRLAHVAVYLRGGKAAEGGNLRTLLFVAGAIVTLVLVVITGWTVIW